ncbi:MAG: hypothetical protein Q3959_04270 [Limosilactobacillus sp.]|uniref:hypothetical protein n=1 Tax=Limosilactobacillus sp. TaxID=2773925 RepID=UPI00270AF275|nr:hypothetical protein [Limosilactobacillus sp.]
MVKIVALAMSLMLIIANICGNNSKKEKHVANWLIISRVAFFIFLAVSVVKLIRNYPVVVYLNILWLLYLTVVYIFMESTFRLKRETFGNPHRSHLVTAALLISFVVIIVFF